MGKTLELLASRDRRELVPALSIVIAGFLIFAWTIFSGISGIGGDLIQATAPGTVDLDLQDVGEYTIFYENVSFVDGRFYSTGDAIPSGLEMEVVDLSSGEKADLHPSVGGSTYTIGGRSGRSIAAFAIDHPGVYRMTSRYSPGSEGPEVALAVGHDFVGKMISMMLVSSAAFFGSIIIAAIILVSIQRKRGREEERLREEARMIRGR